MLRRSYIVGLLLSFFLLIHAGAAAYAAPVQITDSPANQGRPDVQGSIIVWKDLRAGNWDIYTYNLLTDIEEAVETNPAYQNVPATNGSLIAWQDDRSGANDIYIRNLATGATELIVSGAGNQGLPAIDGNLVAYVDDARGSNDIYVINLDTRVVTPVSTHPANQWQPRISGTVVVWEDNRGGNWDVYMRDLAGGGEIPVAAGAGDQRVADVDGDTVAWQDYTGGRYNIGMKNIVTGQSQMVTDDNDYQGSPRVSKDLIVWENYSYAANNYDIFARDLTAGSTLVVAGGPQIQARPAVDGETVVWEEDSAGSYNVWMERIADVTPPEVRDVTPGDGEDCGCQAAVLTANLSDNRTGVDAYTARLLLDGEDVTAGATITAESLNYQTQRLADGSHTATIEVSDIAGNTTTTTWQFVTSSPELALDFGGSFWASYADFVNRELSVNYEIINNSYSALSSATEIVASASTSGVLLVSPMPHAMGSLEAMSSREVTVRYLVPMSVSGFRTSIYLRSVSSCGIETFLPGPPPGLA